jgi:hypothetical protein
MEESDHGGVVHSKTILRNSKERDLDHDIDDYEDSRIELKATGHNLVGLLNLYLWVSVFIIIDCRRRC